ncbi:light harvesting complex protein [Tribonema minus]|uniref:Light harvesting complex protein n=1 Tax=Tribonema minus TaxID=303371 RepID=A0A835Z019_9STRA|nr:light harvesting complex protein [Tribonema minus]
MKAVAACSLALAAGASAFVAPSSFAGSQLARVTSAKSALSMEFAGGLIGADGPEPTTKNFDPLGLAEKGDVLFYREAELKHCRLAMLAVVGMVVPNFVRLPGDIFQGVNVVDAHNLMVEKGPMVMVLFWVSLFELLTAPLTWNMAEKDREPGDFMLDPLGFCKDPEKKKRYQLSELKNGRLAMLAFSGMITQAVLTGHDFPYLY